MKKEVPGALYTAFPESTLLGAISFPGKAGDFRGQAGVEVSNAIVVKGQAENWERVRAAVPGIGQEMMTMFRKLLALCCLTLFVSPAFAQTAYKLPRKP
ncbi:MAG: hypothetical protein HY650_13520 [Acidobacteria bacterium]|nr:hypothetical protein [Acidobacteriota bacterium]